MNQLNSLDPLEQKDPSDLSNLPPVQSRTRGGVSFAAGRTGIASTDNKQRLSGESSASSATRESGGKGRGVPNAAVSTREQERNSSIAQSKDKHSHDYVVGYGKPPKHSRFEKGKSGNLKGRGKGARNLRSLYLEERDAKVTVTENGQRRIVTKGAIAVKTLFSNVAKGQPKAFDQVLKLESLAEIRVDGGSKGNGEALLGQPLAERNAELLDTYFAKRLAALNSGKGGAEDTAKGGMKRPKLRPSPSVPSPTKLPKSAIEVDKVEREKDDGRIPVLLSQQPPSRRTLPLRAIKDD